ncbi:Putative peptidoglycan binding domain protein [Roseivivax jejudonensis]|uniref:Putative peptidoglycan binding domain protein n=1 Tax=Roseivivax jejudonensis TaxID=1529041 RepID=A0A1X7A0C2_9RHOB|nr:peptidoglycan-binding protein [Roseivivax jejudonensis]SLN66953.1 Putative peptidoglycan binding domain protein [Roseivivax jejudonensis]
MIRHVTAAALVAATVPVMALADGDALILANGEYQSVERLRGANRVLAAADPLSAQDFDVVTQVEGDSADMEEALGRFLAGLDADTDRVAVILSGRFVHSAAETYLLPVDAPLPLDPAAVMTGALPLSAVLGPLADHPGQAVLLLAEDEMEPLEDAAFLRAGLGRIDTPQGVSLVRGAPREIAELARRDLATPSRDFVAAVDDAGLELEGYAPPRLVFVEAGTAPADEAADTPPEPEAPEEDRGEARLWASVESRDDVAGYETYLSAYPDGPNAAAARDRLAELRDAPRRAAEAREAALDLDRDARRAVQQDLTALGRDTRGVDGIFGPGTRSAIRAWQEAEGREVTGYLTAAQIDRIGAAADRARAQAEAEAERADRALWQEIGPEPNAPALRRYLERFPDGIYAAQAQRRLDRLVEAARQRAAVRDRDAFEAAEQRDTVASYRDYLAEFPEGAYANRAESRIAALQGANDGRAAARAEESALGLPQAARALAEQRLAAAGVDPGRTDGVFDERTRRALRQYQQNRDLPVSGFLDNATAARLLAETIFGGR